MARPRILSLSRSKDSPNHTISNISRLNPKQRITIRHADLMMMMMIMMTTLMIMTIMMMIMMMIIIITIIINTLQKTDYICLPFFHTKNQHLSNGLWNALFDRILCINALHLFPNLTFSKLVHKYME